MNKINKKNSHTIVNEPKSSLSNSKLYDLFFSEKKEANFKIVAFIGFLLPLILIYISYTYFGSYFETNDDVRFVMQMKGRATPFPFKTYWMIYTFTVDMYIFLYQHFPSFSWYGFSLFFLLLGSLFNFFIALYLIAKKRINLFLIILIFIAFFFLIYFQNVYWLNFTRPSILTTASYFILLTVLYLNSEILKNNKWILIFPSIAFLLAYLNRMEAGVLSFAIASAFCTLLLFRDKNIIPFILKFALPVIVIMATFYAIGKYNVTSDTKHANYFYRLALYQNYFDFRNSGSFIPKNITDTIAFNALNARYGCDDNVISDKFLNRIINESTVIKNSSEKKLEEELAVFNKSLEEEHVIAKTINYSFLFIMVIWFLTASKKNYFIFIKYILFQLFFIMFIFAIGYFMKLPARIYSPLLVIFTFSNMLFLFSYLKFEKKQFYYILAIPLIFIFSSYSKYAKSNSDIISSIKQYGKINKSIMDDMNYKFSNTVFLPIPLRAWEMHTATDPFKEFDFKNNNCYAYLSIDICNISETKDQFVSKFGTSNHFKLFENISQSKNAIFISDDSYNNFLIAYYHYIYHQDYYFEKVFAEPAPFTQFTGLDYYRLKKIK